MATKAGGNSILAIQVHKLFAGNIMHTKKETYQITIEGHIGLDWSDSFEEVSVQHTAEGQTILMGSLPDQTALHGVLMRIRDLGLSLVEVKRITPLNLPQ
jgi:hypothetical protein